MRILSLHGYTNVYSDKTQGKAMDCLKTVKAGLMLSKDDKEFITSVQNKLQCNAI